MKSTSAEGSTGLVYLIRGRKGWCRTKGVCLEETVGGGQTNLNSEGFLWYFAVKIEVVCRSQRLKGVGWWWLKCRLLWVSK